MPEKRVDEWWVVPGVKPPVYVGLRGERRGRAALYLAVSIMAMVIGEALNFFPPGTSMLIASLLIMIQFIATYMETRRRGLQSTDIPLIQNTLRALSGRIVAWSVVSRHIPVACRLAGGTFLYIAYMRGRPYYIIVKPKLYLSLANKHRITIRRTKRGYEITIPLPENPRIWYKALATVETLDASRTTPTEIASRITR